MDPDEILQVVTQKLREGVSPDEINAVLSKSEDLPANNILELREIAAGEDPRRQAALRRQAEGESPLAFATPLVSGLSGELLDDVLAGLEKIGVGKEGAAERFRGDVELATEGSPVAANVARIGGLLASPATKLGAKAVSGAAGLLGRGAAKAGEAAARGVGGGPLPQLATREAARGVGATVGGGAAGGAEGFLFDLATREGSLEERVDEGVGIGTLLGAGVGTAANALGSGMGSVRRISRGQKRAGEEAAESIEEFGKGLPDRRGVNARVARAEEARKAAFEQAEAAGRELPGDVADQLAKPNKNVRDALKNAANQGSSEAQKFLDDLKAFEAGDANFRPAPSFALADDVRRQLNFKGDVFERDLGLLSPDAPPPSGTAAKEAGGIGRRLEETLMEVPGFDRALAESAAAGTQARAFKLGQQAQGKGADLIEDLVKGKKVQVGGSRVKLPEGEAVRQAFRAGVIRPEIQTLRGGAEQAKNWLNKLETSSELQNKMKVALGGADELEQFMEEAQRLRALGQLEGVAELAVKSAGFFAFGSSLVGGGAVPFVFDN